MKTENMEKKTIGAIEAKFADLVWENAPMTTSELIKRCNDEFNWKRTTTYTVLKKFCDGEIFKMENSKVEVVVTRDEFYSSQSAYFIDEKFNGSLPSFIAAFTRKRKLTKEEAEEIYSIIESYTE